jgi:tRNA-binding protein
MRHNPPVMPATWEEFEGLQLTVGRIVEVEELPHARVPAWKLTIDFGEDGTRRSSAQITHYSRDELLGRQVVCVLGFEPKRIARFSSEVLVLGAMSDEHGVVLLRPDREVADGTSVA